MDHMVNVSLTADESRILRAIDHLVAKERPEPTPPTTPPTLPKPEVK